MSMLLKIYSILFSSRSFLISWGITLSLIVLLYSFYIKTSASPTIETNFFGAGLVTIPSLVFYLFYYNRLFKHSYFRFLKLNTGKKSFFTYVWYLIAGLSLVLFFSCMLIYIIKNSLDFGRVIIDGLFFKNVFFLLLLQVFLSSLTFLITAYSTSIWILILSIFYFLSEDSLVLYLKLKEYDSINDFLPENSFSNAFAVGSLNWLYLIPIFYLSIIILFIYKKDYIKL